RPDQELDVVNVDFIVPEYIAQSFGFSVIMAYSKKLPFFLNPGAHLGQRPFAFGLFDEKVAGFKSMETRFIKSRRVVLDSLASLGARSDTNVHLMGLKFNADHQVCLSHVILKAHGRMVRLAD